MLYLITDGGILRKRRALIPTITTVLEAALGAVDFVQLREQRGAPGLEATDEEVVELGRELLPIIHSFRAKLIVNRRVDLMEKIGADGVHIGSSFSDLQEAVAPIVGFSAHHPQEVARAFDLGAAYVLLGPIFTPLSKKPGGVVPLGVEAVRACSKSCNSVHRLYALGGMTSNNALLIKAAGAHGVATIGAVLRSENPAKSAADIVRRWRTDQS